jgi:hypothetical protein
MLSNQEKIQHFRCNAYSGALHLAIWFKAFFYKYFGELHLKTIAMKSNESISP